MNGFFSGILYLLLGTGRDSLQQPGDWSLRFSPGWPAQALVGAVAWNVTLSILIVLLMVYVYRRENLAGWRCLFLGVVRALTLGFILLLLNKPSLTCTQSKVEPSVLAIMIDDSASMSVADVEAHNNLQNQPRLSAVKSLLSNADGKLLSNLAAKHSLSFYRFDRDASQIATAQSSTAGTEQKVDVTSSLQAIRALQPVGTSTQVLPSILTVSRELQNAHVAGIVILTDGRSTTAPKVALELEQLDRSGMKVYPIAIGSDRAPKNIRLQSMQLNDIAFSGDIINVKAILSATGYEPNHVVRVALKDRKTGITLTGLDAKPLETALTFSDDQPRQVEFQWLASGVGAREVSVEAIAQTDEIDQTDNVKNATVSVLEAKVSVLFVDGSPRWDYRYLTTALLRDKSISLSCLLASADSDFLPDGNQSLPSAKASLPGHFPDTLEQMMQYDVLLLGDVDPHYFSSSQLQLINESVSRGQGLMMIAGPRWSPQAYRNTPVEPLLPVTLSKVEQSDPDADITKGFRPIVTIAGRAEGIFRFFSDVATNDAFIRDHLPPLFWYCRGITAKPGVGEVLAEHPFDLAPDGHKAPLLVAGRFGGRTLFSAVDDSWRWRFFNEQHVFDSYWLQQVRYLARNKKIGQHRVELTTDRPEYELGEQINLTLRVIDPALGRQLPAQIQAQVRDGHQSLVQSELMDRQDNTGDPIYRVSFPAKTTGTFNVQLPHLPEGTDTVQSSFNVVVPQLELVDPRIDRIQLSKLASQTSGKLIEFADAQKELEAIPSAQKIIPLVSERPLLNTPLTLLIFMLLVSTEWVVRKVYGMI